MSESPCRLLLLEETASYMSHLNVSLSDVPIYPPQFEVVYATTFEEALHRLTDEPIDIILLDLTLPDNQGLQGLARTHEQAPGVPIVVLSADDQNVIQQSIQRGAQDYLIKERLNSETLIHALLCAVERYRIRQQLQQYIHDLQNREAQFQQLINRNADGIVVIDREGMVRFINPAAEVLFGQKSENILGSLFGFPILAGETAEIDILRKGSREPGVAEMRVVETEWNGEATYLISLRDITDRKNLEISLRYSEEFNRSILDSIDAYIVVLDEHGTVITSSNPSNQAALRTSDLFVADKGKQQNYFDACQRVFGKHSQILTGMKSVLLEEMDSFAVEYRHNTTAEERWFQVRVTPLESDKKRYIVVSYNDVTERRRAAQAEAEAQASAVRVKEQEREIRGLLQLANSSHTSVTAGLFGMQPLHESAPLVFEELLQRYSELIDMAMEQRAFKVEHGITDALRSMAERLGFLRAGPRDVVEIHSKVLKRKSEGVNSIKVQAYTEEGRLMVLELMGYLVSYYRNYSLGTSKTFTPQPST